MTLIEHLRGWDEMPEDDSEAFRWLDLKTAEAADELEFLQQQLVDARRTSEYWKANHLAGNEQLAFCQAALADTEALEIGTGERLAKVEQQLAAALAACKLKDEALLLAAETYNSVWESHMPIIDTEMDKALAIQPDDSALKAWLGEPVGEVKRHTGSLKDMAIIVWAGQQPEEGTKLYSPKGLK